MCVCMCVCVCVCVFCAATQGPNPLAVQKKKKKSGAPNNTDAQAKNTTAHTGAGEGAQPGHAPQGLKRAREDTGTGREGVQQVCHRT